MDKIKLNIWQLSVDDKMRWAGAITEAIARDDSPARAGDLAESVKATTASLRAAHAQTLAARKQFLEKASYLVDMEDRWNQVMTDVVQRLRAEMKDEEEKMAVAGFYLRATSCPDTVIDLAVSAGDSEGTLEVMFDPVRGADVYEVQSSLSPSQRGWNTKAVSITSKVTLSGLASGHQCWVRVRTVGPTGIGPWSEPVSKIVP